MRRAAWVVLVLGTVGVAHADAIDGPPACPPGARGDSAHEGQWCEPWPCTADAECDGGRCVPWRVCTRVATVVPGGLRPTEPPPEPRTLVVATCAPSAACTGTEEPPPPTVGRFEDGAAPTCTEARFCVPVALPPFPSRPAVVAEPASRPLDPPPSDAVPSAPASSRNCGCRAVGTRAGGGSFALLVVALVMWRRR